MVSVNELIRANEAGLTSAIERAESYDDSKRIRFGFEDMDGYFVGMDEGTVFIFGAANAGKSSYQLNLMLRAVAKSPDLTVLDFTLDDSRNLRLYRAVGILGKAPTTMIKCPDAFSSPQMVEQYEERMKHGWELLRKYKNRYIVCAADINPAYANIEVIEQVIDTVRTERPDGRLLVAIDSFDNMNIKGRSTDKIEREEYISNKLKNISNIYKAPIFMTGHIRKAGMRRPSIEDLKGSGGKGFDAMAAIAIYNDVSRDGEAANVFWDGSDERGLVVKKPILEANVVKNKYMDKKGTTFFYFFPDQGRIQECEPGQQGIYRSMVY